MYFIMVFDKVLHNLRVYVTLQIVKFENFA